LIPSIFLSAGAPGWRGWLEALRDTSPHVRFDALSALSSILKADVGWWLNVEAYHSRPATMLTRVAVLATRQGYAAARTELGGQQLRAALKRGGAIVLPPIGMAPAR